MLVAGWPRVALLLSVELLVHRPVGRERGESPEGPRERCDETRREDASRRDREARGAEQQMEAGKDVPDAVMRRLCDNLDVPE